MESDASIRGLTDKELAELDDKAASRGGIGRWMTDGGPWAPGQIWIGDLKSAIAAFGGVAVDRPGNWVVTNRDGVQIAMSLRAIELPSGLTLWAPFNFVTPIPCGD